MPSLTSFVVQALVLSLLCPAVLSRERQSRPRRLEDLIQNKRGICYDDDTLESFKYWIVDSAPYCSSLLSIVDFTQTMSGVSRTTTTTVSTTYDTVTATTTVPAVTVFSTLFVPTLAKREDLVPTSAPEFYQENPYASAVVAQNINASIAASYRSACSCLHLKPSTVNSLSVSSTTRNILGIDYEETTVFVSVTTGTTTSILTRQGSSYTLSTTVSVIPLPVPTSFASEAPSLSTGVSVISPPGASSYSTVPYSNFTTFVTSGTGVSSGLPPLTNNLTISSFSASASPVPSFNISITSLPISVVPTNSANSTVTSLPASAFPINSANLSITSLPTSAFPINSANLTITSLTTSGFPMNSANSSITSRPTSGFPINSANLSITSSPTSGFPINSANLSITPIPTSGFPINSANLSITSLPTSGFPINSANLSITASPTSGFPINSANLSITSQPSSGIPLPSFNYSVFPVLPTSTSNISITSLPSGAPVPSLNLTITSPAVSGYPTPPANLITYTLTSVSASNVTYTYPVPPNSLSVVYSTGMQTFTVTYSPSFATPTATASTTTSAPTADPSSLNIQSCPGLNGTNVDLPDGQAFAVVCGTNYGGPVDVGLYEGSFGKCVQDCGISNNGFSAPRCRGVTYLPYTTGGQVNCFWKNAAALDEFTADPNAVSAVLVTLPLLSVTIAVPTVFPTPFPTPTA